MYRLILALTILLITTNVTGQKKEIFVHPNFQEISDAHVKIAVLPLNISLALHPAYEQEVSDEEYEQMKVDLSYDFQRAFELEMNYQKGKKAFRVRIQDTRTTNRILEREDIDFYTLIEYSAEELAEILEVDAVMRGAITSKSKGSLLLAETLVSIAGVSQNIQTSILDMQLVDRKGKELWRYKNKIGKGVFNDEYTTGLPLLRKAARSLPYY